MFDPGFEQDGKLRKDARAELGIGLKVPPHSRRMLGQGRAKVAKVEIKNSLSFGGEQKVVLLDRQKKKYFWATDEMDDVTR